MSQFIVALMKMTPGQRTNADPAKAAAKYGIRLDWATWWINRARAMPEVWPVK